MSGHEDFESSKVRHWSYWIAMLVESLCDTQFSLWNTTD